MHHRKLSAYGMPGTRWKGFSALRAAVPQLKDTAAAITCKT